MNACSCSNSCCGPDFGSARSVPVFPTELTLRDRIDNCKARWDIGRMHYVVPPGLYRIGDPAPDSPVLATANYKMSVDALRRELTGRNLWLLILDTKGINVWCSAGEGTFCADELALRISEVRLTEFISHRSIILPQLCASGLSAHEAKRLSGFEVIYGPVRSSDMPYFLDNGLTVLPHMRKVEFNLYDRLVLTPVELVAAMDIMLKIFGVMALLNAIGLLPMDRIDYFGLLGAMFSGVIIAPLLLPWIPVRAFAAKGFVIGMIWALFVNYYYLTALYGNVLQMLSYTMILPALSSYFTMNFTGASTYTSPSGVYKEMKRAIPLMIFSLISGAILRCIAVLIG